MTTPEVTAAIVSIAFASVGAGAGITAFFSRFTTKSEHKETIERMEKAIDSISDSIQEIVHLTSDMKAQNERIASAHQRIDTLERALTRLTETYG